MKDFFNAYVECALWASIDDEGEPLDNGDYEPAPETIERFKADCAAFYEANRETWRDGGWTDEQAGHDFWLTRNGHGAGFWDRGWGDEEMRNKLTKAAEAAGECGLYVGDDGLVYAC